MKKIKINVPKRYSLFVLISVFICLMFCVVTLSSKTTAEPAQVRGVAGKIVKNPLVKTFARIARNSAGILPPSLPSQSIAPTPDFTSTCATDLFDESSPCINASLEAINNGSSTLESLPSLNINTAVFNTLSVQQQTFIITNLERLNRKLPPIAGMTAQLNNVAQSGAINGSDPKLPTNFSLTGGGTWLEYGSNYAGGTYNPLASDYDYMYYDGYPGVNIECQQATDKGCWGHRVVMLTNYADAN